jgi:hypothetical protein
MNWAHLEGHIVTPKELADYMEQGYTKAYGKLERAELANQMEKGITARVTPMPNFWKETIEIIRSRDEDYF